MSADLSPNTQAILLLTAPLIVGRGTSTSELLTPREYKHLARHLRDIGQQPADLIGADGADVSRACETVVAADRLQRLLGRGVLLAHAVDRWQTRAIWVISRADADYPRRLKDRLQGDAPAVLYGCGDIGRLDHGGLAVVGSRRVEEALIDYTMSVASLAARSSRAVISGGAKGIDQAAMRGALEAGGQVCGVLADSLERNAMTREHRDLVLDGQLTLVSPYDPSAGFNVGHAMQRNKLIYALADASLVVSSDVGKGGTWAGAVEQLGRLRLVPVYVRSTGDPSPGLDALLEKGALAWPNPDVETFEEVFTSPAATVLDTKRDEPFLLDRDGRVDRAKKALLLPEPLPLPPVKEKRAPTAEQGSDSLADVAIGNDVRETSLGQMPAAPEEGDVANAANDPAESLFALVRDEVRKLLAIPMKDVEVACHLRVEIKQMKAWLTRLIDEGVIEKQRKPAGYIARRDRLFG